MNVSRLGVANAEVLVRAVAVRTLRQLAVQRQYIVHQSVRKSLHVGLIPFAKNKFSPGREQVLNRNDILQGMTQLNGPIPGVYPPPTASAPRAD